MVTYNTMRELVLIGIFVFLCSCSSESKVGQSRSPSDGAPGVTGTTQRLPVSVTGVYTLAISPETATRDTTVNLIFTGFDAHDARIEWLLNGEPAESAGSPQFKVSQARKGDKLQARARIQDREILSNIIDVVNTPPVITEIKMLSDTNKASDTLSVAASASDGDGDRVNFLYEWTKNGVPAGAQQRIEGPVKRGDAVVVKVTPYDGEHHGRPVVLNRVMQNLPPIIQESKEFQFDGTVYTYQVLASDPDNDTLAYALESPSPGMTIDKANGFLTWNVPAEYKGKKDVTVLVTDGHGGITQYVLNISIQ